MKRDENFQKMLKFVLAREGGYVNNPNDKGGETNQGITHSTYDTYRKSQGLPIQSVKNITDKEVADIYYNNYYKASGADKIDDPQMGMYVFDTAINMGVSTAKDILNKSGGDVDKYEQLRREKYQKYVDYDKSQEVFLKGWNNRVDQLKNYANQTFPNKKFDIGIEMNVDGNGNPVDYYVSTINKNGKEKIKVEAGHKTFVQGFFSSIEITIRKGMDFANKLNEEQQAQNALTKGMTRPVLK